MNAVSTPPCYRWMLLALCCLPFLAGTSFAAESLVASITLPANLMMEVVGDRSRMIQVSLVAVVFGCALLWWRR